MDIIGKIRTLQGERDWTDYKLAQEAGIPLATLSSLFQRKNPPKIETLQYICHAYGLTLAQFFWEDEKIEIVNDQEKDLLQKFRRLSSKQQQALISLLTE